MLCRIVTAVALVSLLSGCAPAAPGPTSGPASSNAPVEKRSANQSFTIAQVGLPANMSPAASGANYAVYSTLYDALVKLDRLSNAVPWLAEKWEAPNATTWRFTLRKGVGFGNGDPLTAEDVEFSVKQAIADKWPAVQTYTNLADVKMVDANTVDFIMKVPDASILPSLASMWIVPKKYFTEVGASGFAAKPIGSGPYELMEYRGGDLAHMRKKAAKHAFRQASPTDLTFRSIPEGTTMVAGFRTGDLDVLIGQVSPDQVALLKSTDAIIDVRHPGVNYAVYSQPESLQRNTPLAEKRVRIALNYAIDRNAIANTVYRGYANPVGQFSVPDSLSWNDSIKPYPYDPAMAKKLLAEAGYPNGFKLPIGIEYTPQTTNPQLAAALQGYLRDVGVEANVTQLELGVFLDKYYRRNNQTLGDLFMVTTQTSNSFGGSQFTNMVCSRNWWCNPEFDKYQTSVAVEADKDKRAPMLQAAIRILRDDVATMDLLAVPEFVIQQAKLKGFVWEAPQTHNFETLYRIE